MTTVTSAKSHRYSISEAAKMLDRSPHTLRSWDRNEVMPKRLRPPRDDNGNRYWTKELIEEIKGWIAKNNFHPGRGIDYHPSPARLQKHIESIRFSSKRKGEPSEQEWALRLMIEEAMDVLKFTEEQIVNSLSAVVEQYDISLEDALRVAADVFASR